MKNNTDENVKVVSWQEIRNDVIAVNPHFAQIIDNLSPNEKYPLIKARYRYGSFIIHQGKLQLPLKTRGQSSISSSGINPSIASLLNNPSIPLALLLNKMSDIFLLDNDSVVPLKVFNPGDLFGTFETINYFMSEPMTSLWNVSAGSRLIFTLPSISEVGRFKKLKCYYQLSSDRPRMLKEHWNLFTHIANHPRFEEPRVSDVIFFTPDWFSPDKAKDKSWHEFHLFLFQQGWKQAKNCFDKENFSFFWRTFIKTIYQRRYIPPYYLIDTFKYLILINMGQSPAFQPITTDLTAPYRGWQNALLNVYELKKYIPTFMHLILPDQDIKKRLPLYYSLAFPTVLENDIDKQCRSSTLMADLRNLKFMFDMLMKNINRLGFFRG